ncbi:MAG: RsmB/NOP family class I SAM-dependent RNA methyltransferase [Chitinophagaceae bacterium]|nr:RsmB/NOP family class I SAM-dependent RNA methyltransferase [Chitinophagaceae bacterium]
MQLPDALLASLQGLPGYHAAAFQQAHRLPAPVSVRLHPTKSGRLQLPLAGSVPWAQHGYFLHHRPAFAQDPAWHAGAYYVQEASSMAVEQAFLQHRPAGPLRVLDLCAAPGGKSTHLLSLLNAETDILVTNDVIQSRANILLENVVKWGLPQAIVTNNDPADFGRLTGSFDVMLVDAPCSGSGLFRRDPEAIKEWSPANVQLCSQRQQRILADVLPALKEGGLLIYATCSYSFEEDERIADWLYQLADWEALSIDFPPAAGPVLSHSPQHGHPCYRFYPHQVSGEGFFLSAFRKKEAVPTFRAKPARSIAPPEAILRDMQRWLLPAAVYSIYQHEQQLYAMPPQLLDFFQTTRHLLKVKRAGLLVGEWQRNGLQPDHALAVSTWAHPQLPATLVDVDMARQYLRKEAMMPAEATLGWSVVNWEGHRLGWLKHLGPRSNNYYPKEWRLRTGGD